MCPVLAAVAGRAERGTESWGTPHPLPPVPDKATADKAVKSLYRARNHTGLKRGGCGSRALSVRAVAIRNHDGTWTITLQVWDRKLGKKEIARRVQAGESLKYNVLRRH